MIFSNNVRDKNELLTPKLPLNKNQLSSSIIILFLELLGNNK